MALSEIDRNLLERCLARKPRSWEDFVDRFLGLVFHVIDHTAQCRSVRLTVDDRDDLAAETFLAFVKDDFSVLRRFRGGSSLATYLTVVARRVVVREMLKRNGAARLRESSDMATEPAAEEESDPSHTLDDRDQVERLLAGLNGPEAQIVRMFHLDGRSYQEISSATGLPENSIGPTLSRARLKMRGASADSMGS